MTHTEFKAWFEGFAENIAEAPSPEQWARIKARVAEIGAPAPVPVRDDTSVLTWPSTGTGIRYNPDDWGSVTIS